MMNIIQRQVRLGLQGLQNVRFFWDHPRRGKGKRKFQDRRWAREVDETVPNIKYHGFVYYPRPNEVDPPYTPTKMFVVQRIAKVSGNHRFDQKILGDLGLIGKMADKVIVKNTPQMNQLLYQIKHLIKIKPLTFPNGEPTAEDIKAGATVLNEYGEMTVHKKLGSSNALVAPPKPLSVHDPPPRSADGLGLPSDETMRRHLKLQWDTGMDKRGIL